MHPVFHSEFIGLDWPILFVAHIIMFWSLAVRVHWSWIPFTDHEKLCGSKGDACRAQVNSVCESFETGNKMPSKP